MKAGAGSGLETFTSIGSASRVLNIISSGLDAELYLTFTFEWDHPTAGTKTDAGHTFPMLTRLLCPIVDCIFFISNLYNKLLNCLMNELSVSSCLLLVLLVGFNIENVNTHSILSCLSFLSTKMNEVSV
jgi:hypothetical protein